MNDDNTSVRARHASPARAGGMATVRALRPAPPHRHCRSNEDIADALFPGGFEDVEVIEAANNEVVMFRLGEDAAERFVLTAKAAGIQVQQDANGYYEVCDVWHNFSSTWRRLFFSTRPSLWRVGLSVHLKQQEGAPSSYLVIARPETRFMIHCRQFLLLWTLGMLFWVVATWFDLDPAHRLGFALASLLEDLTRLAD